ncbi:MAG: type II 3-dehydroquinate dehydratase [Clostridiales bacterium]|jgi:3-dehydroquinate dehydratase-2|nr:type II 3-dehydroquinate dehydratase [Clostridiales bacterium]
MKIGVIHGPNINFLGTRQPEVYGNMSFAEVCGRIQALACKDLEIVQFQSNCEGEIVDFIQRCHSEEFSGLVINPAAFAHYSYAIADALASISPPVIEVHLTNIAAREEFRQKSVTAAACIGQISGFGVDSYLLAIKYLISLGGI